MIIKRPVSIAGITKSLNIGLVWNPNFRLDLKNLKITFNDHKLHSKTKSESKIYTYCTDLIEEQFPRKKTGLNKKKKYIIITLHI